MAGCIYRPHSNAVPAAGLQVESWDAAAAGLAEAKEYLSAHYGFRREKEIRAVRRGSIHPLDPNEIRKIGNIRAIVFG